jgi:hypothetical protein
VFILEILMKFIQLNRSLIPVEREEDTSEWEALLGHKYGGWLRWPEILEKSRAVLLAEASSGKTEEFRSRARILTENGQAGFFLRIEDLADGVLVDGLDPADEERFLIWLKNNAPGWFLLDSVDEARLNHKSIERALRRFAKDLGPALKRAHVYLSCRVSDWKGQRDRELIERLLPVEQQPEQDDGSSTDDLLLRPILDTQKAKSNSDSPASPEPVSVFRLAPLNKEQWAALAHAAGVIDVEAFSSEIERTGLEVFAERPGAYCSIPHLWKITNLTSGRAWC